VLPIETIALGQLGGRVLRNSSVASRGRGVLRRNFLLEQRDMGLREVLQAAVEQGGPLVIGMVFSREVARKGNAVLAFELRPAPVQFEGDCAPRPPLTYATGRWRTPRAFARRRLPCMDARAASASTSLIASWTSRTRLGSSGGSASQKSAADSR
jgi:hypothetical protein